MDEATIENYKVINGLVQKYFNLTEQSKKDFEHILFNPDDAPEYALIASQPDRRLFLEVDPTLYEKEDKVWNNFKSYFSNIVKSSKINYSDFIVGRKDGKKIMNVIFDSITSSIDCFFEMIHTLSTDGNFTEIFYSKYFPKNIALIELEGVNKLYTESGKVCIKIGKKTIKKRFNTKEISSLINEGLKESFSSYLNRKFLGVRVSSSKYICFSLNFADFILASTEDGWGSCISMKSDCGFWNGLAGLVGDKNRIVVFATDKTEKTFEGIKSYKMFNRSWGFLYKSLMNDKIFLRSNIIYPNKNSYFDFKKYKECFPDNIIFDTHDDNNLEGNLYSLYEFPTIFHNFYNNRNMLCFTSSIYEDKHQKRLNPYNLKSYYSTANNTEVCCHTIYKDGTIEEGDCSFYNSRSFPDTKEMIDKKRKLSDIFQ